MKEKDRLEYVRRYVKGKMPKEAANIWKHAAKESEAVGNWEGAIECYEKAEATGMVNCGYELSLIYTHHLLDFEKAKSCLMRSGCKPMFYSLYMGRLLSAFNRHDEALSYFLESMQENIRGQILDTMFQEASECEEKIFEWLWDDETTGGFMTRHFDVVLKDLLRCYNDSGCFEHIDFKSIKQVVDEIIAQNDYEDESIELIR